MIPRLGWLPVLVLISCSSAASAPKSLVVCAPGLPGDTVQAQPTMDAFGRFVEESAGWKRGSLTAVYHETEAPGAARIAQDNTVLALVTLPFFAKYRSDLGLVPRLEVVSETGSSTEIWSVVAKRGAITSSASLEGWEVTGLPGFAPEFVREGVLGAWGALPASTRITFTSRVSSSLLKAASGQKLAVIVDGEQAKALPSHPRAADLEIVAASTALPSSLVCTVRDRGGRDVEALLQALLRLHRKEGGAEILASLRMTRFEPADKAAIENALRDPGRRPDSGK